MRLSHRVVRLRGYRGAVFGDGAVDDRQVVGQHGGDRRDLIVGGRQPFEIPDRPEVGAFDRFRARAVRHRASGGVGREGEWRRREGEGVDLADTLDIVDLAFGQCIDGLPVSLTVRIGNVRVAPIDTSADRADGVALCVLVTWRCRSRYGADRGSLPVR